MSTLFYIFSLQKQEWPIFGHSCSFLNQVILMFLELPVVRCFLDGNGNRNRHTYHRVISGAD